MAHPRVCLQKATTTREAESSVLNCAGCEISTVPDMVIDEGRGCGRVASKSIAEGS